MSDRPMNVGDYCEFGTLTVPNGAFSAMTLESFSRVNKTLFHITLNLLRDTTPEEVRAVESVATTLRIHPKTETGAMPVRFGGIGSYSLDIDVFAYVLITDGDEFLKSSRNSC